MKPKSVPSEKAEEPVKNHKDEALEIEMNDFRGRVARCEEEIRPILEKYEVSQGATLKYANEGIFPTPAWVNTKGKVKATA